MIDRRAFLAGIAGGLALPPAVSAQPSRPVRVGVVSAGGGPYRSLLAGLREGLKSLGLDEGVHHTLDVRDTQGDLPASEAAAKDFERQDFAVIVAMPSSVALATKRATSKIPIVFVGGSDPREIGLVDSVARPGGRVTGVHTVTGDLMAKHLQLLKEFVPKLRRALTFYNPANPSAQRSIRAGREAARQMNVTLVEHQVRSVVDIRAALSKLKLLDVEAYVFAADAMVTIHADMISEAATAQRIPTITIYREAVVAGALASYGAPFREIGHLVARPLQRVLAGTRPGDIPVASFDRVALVVNAKTARRLGLTIPSSIVQRASEVIDG